MSKKLDVQQRMASRFKGVGNAKGKRDQVKDLKSEVEVLRNQLERQNSGKFSVAIDRIQPSEQCRQTFTTTIINNRARSLQEEGQLDPLVLIPLDESGHYMIEDGELTWRAASQLNKLNPKEWSQLEAVLSNATDSQNVHFRTLLHHLHSESLNVLDRAESVIREIEIQFGFQSEQAIKLLRNICYRMQDSEFSKAIASFLNSGEQQSLVTEKLDSDQIKLAQFIYRLQLDIVSFVKNDLAMISLAEDLKVAIRQQELSCNNALALNRLSGKNLPLTDAEIIQVRQEITDFVLKNKLSTSDTRRKVTEVISRYVPEEEVEIKTESNKAYDAITTSLKQLSVEQLSKTKLKSLKKSFEAKLKKIDSALSK